MKRGILGRWELIGVLLAVGAAFGAAAYKFLQVGNII